MSRVGSVSPAVVKSFFAGASRNTRVQFFRYGFVAVAAFIVDFGSLAILVSGFHLHYLLGAGVAFLLGLVTNYVLSTIWVFSAYSVKNRWVEFGVFALTGIVGLGLTELFMWLFTDGLHIQYLLSKLITAFMVIVWNFGSRKFLLYRN